MSRKRDTNWTRDEITVLLDSIMEITKIRSDSGRQTNSREVFEYAAKKLGERGHGSRAEREKCRTKWKKMKEEFTHARKARETGEGRVAPGIEPFYNKMLEFMDGTHNISPHSTIARRSSSISSNINNISNGSNSNSNNNYDGNNYHRNNVDNRQVAHSPPVVSNSTTSNGSGTRAMQSGSRTSARIAANTNGSSSTDTGNNSSNNLNRHNNVDGVSDYSLVTRTAAESSPLLRQHSRQMTSSLNNNGANGISNGIYQPQVTIQEVSTAIRNPNSQLNHQQPTTSLVNQNNPQQVIPNGDTCNSFNSSDKNSLITNDINNSLLNSSDDAINNKRIEADISYRTGSGYRQITIFGHHDVDIKFRENCVTINEITLDHASSNGLVNES